MKKRALKTVYFLAFSVAIGALAGFGCYLFRLLIVFFQDLFWSPGASFYEQVLNSPWWLVLLAPAAAGLIAGPIIVFLSPESRGPGVPEVIISVAVRQSVIRRRVTFIKAVVTSLLIGGGASVGREGPVVQIGASVGSSLAQLFKLDPALRRACLASGAAAGIAATFNAPIAGTVFAAEIILMDIELAYISNIVIAAVTASVVSRAIQGEFVSLPLERFTLTSYWELAVYLALGIIAGLISILFIKSVFGTDSAFRKLPLPEWVKPGIGGLLLGTLALWVPQILGVGYESISLALNNIMPLKLAFIILFMKILATSLCIGSGMSGGIFAPSIVIGAALGVVVGLLTDHLFPDLVSRTDHYALVGMAAVIAGTTLAPITAVLTIFELTNTHAIILPLMVACISSSVIVRLLFGYSAYEVKIIKSGLNIVRGHDVNILRNLYIRDFMLKEFEALHERDSLHAITSRAVDSPYPHFVVLNDEEMLVGVISLRDVRGALDKYEELKNIVIANDIMTRDVTTLSTNANLETALNLFEERKISFIPVTEPLRPWRVIGILRKDDLLAAYKERVLKDRLLSRTDQ